jgi:hypothetical protein
MPKVFLVNPSNVTPGYSFITPRWLFVLAGATPVELAGDPILTDESLERFDPNQLSPGDIVGRRGAPPWWSAAFTPRSFPRSRCAWAPTAW